MDTERAERRNQFYDAIPDYWADLYGQEYSLFDVHEVSKEDVLQMREATQRIGHIFFKTAQLLRSVDDETLLDLGFPPATLPYLRLSHLSVESVIARLDLVQHNGSFKCLEINADTPTFIKELHHINGLVCEAFNMYDPNTGYERQLALAVERAIVESLDRLSFDSSLSIPNVVFTAHEDNMEDLHTANYLMGLSNFPARFVPLDQLQIVHNDGLYDDNGDRIDVLYRQTFPIENLIDDHDEEGNPIGQWLLELIAQDKVAAVNPPSAFLLQSKAVQAVIWGLYEERSPFFDEIEHAWIESYFLPTYLEPDPFLSSGTPYVRKPSFGREGDTVTIFNGNGEMELQDAHESYTHFLPVYQKYIDMPMTSFHSETGIKHGSVMFGSFLIGGQAGAIGIRVGNRITDNLSYFLPIGITKP
ncbi:glutathionylspermidine synthase family protein [Paenibacillus sp. MMS18-CY102]|uniref:glutathionylspermidine synthase family protein n=1 Tax=Paenibacillus sp. MMS18-CY102 TaxID=2682849 RepID=UPI00136626C0|nr:glutathionylspermidine synthase family protein [Paenibacillus sp. MMS18-CY102]MWC28127.1 glutathionylspermidine synthase family protein [Paenibacillus sp. MMS18-CY102]